MSIKAGQSARRGPSRIAGALTRAAIVTLIASTLSCCAPKPEVVIVNETAAAIKADVQFPVTTTINGFPMPGKRTQSIIAPGGSDRAAGGVEVASRQVWLRVVSIALGDASLISPAVDPAEFSVDGRGTKVIVTVSAEGRTLRVVAVNEAGETLSLLPYPKESARPADTRQPVFDSIGVQGGDVR